MSGQMKMDLIINSFQNTLYVSDFHLTPISENTPYIYNSEETLINNSHQDNIKTYYANNKGSFYNDCINTEFKHNWPIICKKDEVINSYSNIYDMGCKRSKRYHEYNKQFEFFCPLWLEHVNQEITFKIDVKKHIDAISSKYIIPGVTSNQAIMFLPAEAIFAEINAYHNDLVEYAYKKNVWITSPTTLISTFTTIQVLLKNMERDKYAQIVHNELTKLGIEFQRYKERWDKLSRSIETVNKDVENLNITSDKITKKFEAISDVRLDDKLYLE